MTREELDKLRALAAKATPGPLCAGKESADGVFGILLHSGHSVGYAKTEEDANYIAAANPTTITDLLDHIDRLERLIASRGVYDTEYDGRMYTQCIGCDMHDENHEPGCVVAALITKHAPPPAPYVPPNPVFEKKKCSHCGRQFEKYLDGAKRLRAHFKNKPDCAAAEATWIKAYDTATKGQSNE